MSHIHIIIVIKFEKSYRIYFSNSLAYAEQLFSIFIVWVREVDSYCEL
jgi:hypothetical protein